MSDAMVNDYIRASKTLRELEKAGGGETELIAHLHGLREQLYAGMSPREREAADEWDSRKPLLEWSVTIGLIVVVAILAMAWSKAKGAEPCIEGLPNPPLVVIRADGTEIPVSAVSYELSGRVLRLTETSRIFCTGVE